MNPNALSIDDLLKLLGRTGDQSPPRDIPGADALDPARAALAPAAFAPPAQPQANSPDLSMSRPGAGRGVAGFPADSMMGRALQPFAPEPQGRGQSQPATP